jgi:hypothetical protein
MTTAFSPTQFGLHPYGSSAAVAIHDGAVRASEPVRPRRLPAEVYRRRRVAAAVVMATFLVLVAVTAARLVGGFFTDTADAATATRTEGPVVTVVQPGDTLWTIAADLGTGGELREVVDVLVELNGSSALTVGQRLVLPAG